MIRRVRDINNDLVRSLSKAYAQMSADEKRNLCRVCLYGAMMRRVAEIDQITPPTDRERELQKLELAQKIGETIELAENPALVELFTPVMHLRPEQVRQGWSNCTSFEELRRTGYVEAQVEISTLMPAVTEGP